jgi:hypothetical protein
MNSPKYVEILLHLIVRSMIRAPCRNLFSYQTSTNFNIKEVKESPHLDFPRLYVIHLLVLSDSYVICISFLITKLLLVEPKYDIFLSEMD